MSHTLGGNTCKIMALMRWLGLELMQVSWCTWFGDDGVVILDCDRPIKTQPSQPRVVSYVDFSSNYRWTLTNLTKGAVIRKHIRSKVSSEKQKQVAKDFSPLELLHYFNDIANGIMFWRITLLCVFPKLFCALLVSSIKFLTGRTHAPLRSALSLLIRNRDNKPSLLSVRGPRPDFTNTWSNAGYYDFALRTRCFVTKCYIFKTHRDCISKFAPFRTMLTGLVNCIYSRKNETNNKNNSLPQRGLLPFSWSKVIGT